MAVRSTQCQNRAVRSTQGGRGCHPLLCYLLIYFVIICFIFNIHVCRFNLNTFPAKLFYRKGTQLRSEPVSQNVFTNQYVCATYVFRTSKARD